eukprot:CAMPEP_0198282428 /NCGR_PEP_ID=MMETSP1449-20131203/2253_1 /TAXON_ID=420275 /ORGANISM="Attheya septentrionalis, Strain CCMP2084" /LENGTH=348 /DNA_ID=CAMNT_0043978685 /DNA_START=42 /DNA_END=1088 /DNA_ORIENTATION=+
MSDPPSYALQVAPESALVFNLISSTEPGVDGTPRCAMTLTHTNRTDEYLAFKVKTTQPRRYLVRPNQGLVAPGKTESVSIILVEKDKQLLLQSFDRLGQSALDHSKDKFLVQSCAVSQEFATRYVSEKKKADQLGEGHKTSKDLAEALTGMWNAVAAGDNVSIFNKKLHVRHVVPKTDASSSSNTLGVTSTAATTSSATSAAVLKSLTQDDKGSSSMSTKNLDNLSPEEMHVELTNIRRKYDELVSFSVNLTAERDILNNTLEQTKRDLNREMAARALAENKGASSSSSSGSMSSPPAAASGFALSMMQLVVLAVACFVAGVKLNSRHTSSQSNSIPLMDESEEAAAP